jgi:hypothetical protein
MMKRYSSTRELKENEVLRVYKKGYGYAVLRIIDITDDFFSARGDQGFISSLNKGDRLEAYVWSERLSAYEFELGVLGIIDDELYIVFFKHAEKMRFSRERKCLTAEVEIPFSFFMFDVSNAGKAFSTSEVQRQNGMIIRISDREALVRYNGVLLDERFIKGRLNISGEDIDLVAKVAPTSGGEPNVHLLKFIGMPEREREKILQYVFEVYRE